MLLNLHPKKIKTIYNLGSVKKTVGSCYRLLLTYRNILMAKKNPLNDELDLMRR